MQRFFVTFPLTIDVTLTDNDILHQITRVLRSKIGDHVILFDGDGSEYEYEIVAIAKKEIQLRGVGRTFPKTEPLRQIFLYQALPNKYEKIEYILQKWVEVGIHRFVFFRSDRSQKLAITPAKIERFRLIAREAVEQCGGLTMPSIDFVDSITNYGLPHTNITLDTVWNPSKISDYSHFQVVNLWIWPEGGWSDAERSKMADNSFIFARFWERVLRTETAGIVVAFGLIYS